MYLQKQALNLITAPEPPQLSIQMLPHKEITSILPKIRYSETAETDQETIRQHGRELSVKGTKFILNPQQLKCLQVFERNQAVGSTLTTVDIFSPQLFLHMLRLLEIAHYEFRKVPAVCSNTLEDYLEKEMAAELKGKSGQQLNDLYRIAKYFCCDGLSHYISVVVACRIYIPQDLAAYNKKKQELGIKRDLDEKRIKELQHITPHIN